MPDPEMFALIIPVIIFMIPIVAILTSHQRKMAELMHRPQQQQQDQNVMAELYALRQEVGQLRDRLNSLAITSDQRLEQSPPPVEEHLRQRTGYDQ